MKKYVAAIALAVICVASGDGGYSALARGNGRSPHEGHGQQECKTLVRAEGSSTVVRRLARSKTIHCKSLGRVTVRCIARARPCKQ